MRITKNSVRSLTTNDKGEFATQPSSGFSHLNSSKKPEDAKDKGIGKVSGKMYGESLNNLRTTKVNEATLLQNEAHVEVADGSSGVPTNTSVSHVGGKDHFASIVQDYFDPNLITIEGKGFQGASTAGINQVYRDIYYHDAVGGSAIDLLSNMPFSDFTLSGTKDAKALRPFEESIDNMNVTSLMPVLSNEYLVHGMFCGTTLYDETNKVFKGVIPQNPDYVDVTPVPIFGYDPLISLRTGNALQMLKSSGDPRAKEYLDLIKQDDMDYKPEPEDVIYIPRRGLARDYRGVSAFRRLLMPWLLEKSLFRGTVDQAIKRQRAVTHMTVGDAEWVPTGDEMSQLADMFMAADLDPVGAVFVTRQGVSVAEVKDPGGLWKVVDLEQYFTTAKLRALGISETFLTGETSFNTLDQVMTIFVEQQRAYRDMITEEFFYKKIFNRIAEDHNITVSRYGLETSKSDNPTHRNQIEMFDTKGFAPSFVGAYSTGASGFTDKLIPRVNWHKRLRPEADQVYMDMLTALSEKGIPVPVRIWAAAGGLDLDNMMNQLDDDIAIRAKLKIYTDTLKETVGGGEGDDSFEGASGMLGLPTAGILSRGGEKAMEQYSTRNVDSSGKRHIRSAASSKIAEERMNRKMAKVAAEVARKENAKELAHQIRQKEIDDAS